MDHRVSVERKVQLMRLKGHFRTPANSRLWLQEVASPRNPRLVDPLQFETPEDAALRGAPVL